MSATTLRSVIHVSAPVLRRWLVPSLAVSATPPWTAVADHRRCSTQSSSTSDVGNSWKFSAPLVGLADNKFATGGITIMVAGAAAAILKTIAERFIEYLKRKLLVRAEIDSRDDAYRWVMHWLAQLPEFKEYRLVSVSTSLSSFGVTVEQSGQTDKKRVFYFPAPGDHLVRFHNRWLWISRKRQGGNQQIAANARLLVETLHITTYCRSRQIIDVLLEEACRIYESSQRQRTLVWSVDQDGYWVQVGSRPIRPLQTVVLPGKQAEELLQDCQEFLSSEEWYAHHGIPYRRGYLLYGAPGTGKTSLVTALAGELALDVYVITLSSPMMTDEKLRSLLNSAAARCILLLEDVDAAFVGRQIGADSGASNLTFSGLLNAIDGVAAQEGRLLFLTTNHVDRLSSALVRPGRVDFRLQFKLASREQMKQLFLSFYQDVPKRGEPYERNSLGDVRAVVVSRPATVEGFQNVEEGNRAIASDSGSLEHSSIGDEHDVISKMGTSSRDKGHIPSAQIAGSQVASNAVAALSERTSQPSIPCSDELGRPPGTACDKGEACTAGSAASGAIEHGSGYNANDISTSQRLDEQNTSYEYDDGMQRGVGTANGRTQAGAGLQWCSKDLEFMAEKFASSISKETLSMAELQGYLMTYKKSPALALANVGKLIQRAGQDRRGDTAA